MTGTQLTLLELAEPFDLHEGPRTERLSRGYELASVRRSCLDRRVETVALAGGVL